MPELFSWKLHLVQEPKCQVPQSPSQPDLLRLPLSCGSSSLSYRCVFSFRHNKSYMGMPQSKAEQAVTQAFRWHLATLTSKQSPQERCLLKCTVCVSSTKTNEPKQWRKKGNHWMHLKLHGLWSQIRGNQLKSVQIFGTVHKLFCESRTPILPASCREESIQRKNKCGNVKRRHQE